MTQADLGFCRLKKARQAVMLKHGGFGLHGDF
jgi:hypothetical protein